METLNKIFEKQVEKTPNQIAIEIDDVNITYDEFNKKANQLARLLLSKGVREGDIIAIMMERSINMMVGIMGILKAGAAYLPISTTEPNDRVQTILKESKVNLLIYSDLLFNNQLDIECIDINEGLSDYINSNLDCDFSPDALAYVMFTSGSTGVPKGVMIEHHSVINRLMWLIQEYGINESDIILQKSVYSFDFSIYEIFLWFFVGTKLILLKQGYESNVDALAKIIYDKKITICNFVPSLLNVFIDYVEHKNYISKLKSLKRVFCGGEVLNYSLVEKFNDRVSKTNSTELHNVYGPTETTVQAAFFNCTEYKNADKIVPIGKPVANTNIYILDQNGNQCAAEEHGEIYISGEGVGRGYINNEELTKQRFIPDPFTESQRMYRTGDIGRWKNGFIEYVGRIDNQVKIRGNRIELEEIELHINQFDGISQSVVTVIESAESDKSLEVYYTSKNDIDVNALFEYLSSKLPSYMVPSIFRRVDKFIQTDNGKIDRKMVLECTEIKSDVVKAQTLLFDELTDVQKRIFEIIIANLGENASKDVSIDADFSSIGLNSISFVKTVVALECEFDFDFDDEMLLISKFDTVKSMIEYVESKAQ